MGKRRTSILYDHSKEVIEEAIRGSNSIRETLPKLGLKDVGGNRGTFFDVVKYHKLDAILLELRERTKKMQYRGLSDRRKRLERSDDEVFTKDSTLARAYVKKRIIKNNLISYECKSCENTGEWFGKDLTLQLEHINGINNDHRLENLCFLCPQLSFSDGFFCWKK